MNSASFMSSRASDAASSYTDLAALNDVKKLGRNQDPKAILEVARQFESFFITQLMKEMRAGVDLIGKDNFTNSNEMRFHQQMFDQQMSLDVANKGGYGLAELIARQLTEQFNLNWSNADEPVKSNGLEWKSTPPPQGRVVAIESEDGMLGQDAASVVDESNSLLDRLKDKLTPLQEIISPDQAGESSEKPISKGTFFSVLKDLAVGAAEKLGLDEKVLLAQAALETGWGEFISKGSNGSSNNLFNIKSSGSWQGDSVTVTTVEFREGVAQKEQASFRSYKSYEDSFNDYVNFLQSNPRYEKALSCAPDSEAYLHELQKAGYATDPNYAQKILQLLEQPEFDSGDAQ